MSQWLPYSPALRHIVWLPQKKTPNDKNGNTNYLVVEQPTIYKPCIEYIRYTVACSRVPFRNNFHIVKTFGNVNTGARYSATRQTMNERKKCR